jgi:hypothetical protein
MQLVVQVFSWINCQSFLFRLGCHEVRGDQEGLFKLVVLPPRFFLEGGKQCIEHKLRSLRKEN